MHPDSEGRHTGNGGNAYTPYMSRIPLRDFLEFLPGDVRLKIGHVIVDPMAESIGAVDRVQRLIRDQVPFQHPIRDCTEEFRRGRVETGEDGITRYFWNETQVHEHPKVKFNTLFDEPDTRKAFEDKVFALNFMSGIKKRGAGQFAMQPDPYGLFQDELVAVNPSTGIYARTEISAMWAGWQLATTEFLGRTKEPVAPVAKEV